MKIKTLMYLDKFLEAPELITAFNADKKISLQDIREDVIEDIKKNFNKEAYMNVQDAIDDFLSGGDVSLEHDNAFYMWFESDLLID